MGGSSQSSQRYVVKAIPVDCVNHKKVYLCGRLPHEWSLVHHVVRELFDLRFDASSLINVCFEDNAYYCFLALSMVT